MSMEEGVTIQHLIKRSIEDNLSLEIDYQNSDYEISTRIISDIHTSKKFRGDYIDAYCHLRDEERTFKLSRIIDARIVSNLEKRVAKQLPNYEFDASKPIFSLYGEEY